MKIAQLVSNFYKTSPDSTVAIYNHAALLTNGLVNHNNDVTLYASSDSEVNAKLVSVMGSTAQLKDFTEGMRVNFMHLLISKCYSEAINFDIIHSHFTVQSAFYSSLVDTPSVQAVHSPIDDSQKKVLEFFKGNNFISFSLAQRKQMPGLNWVANVYHGLDLNEFRFNPIPEGYFLYMGRITRDKGVHLAIEAAKVAGVPLLIAGRSYPQEGYWHDEIEKHIDGQKVRYVGIADYDTKRKLLQGAKGLLFPTQWNEPFGLVMIEAMASGTPVIGWNNGSVSEVIQDKETGYLVDSVKGMVKAIKAIDKIDRTATRRRAEKYFSVERMVSGYERVYARVIEQHKLKKKV